MKTEYIIRALAGSMVLLSAALVYFVSPWWLLLTVFVGANLIQSAFTGICPPEMALRRIKLGEHEEERRRESGVEKGRTCCG
jgi:hypothetical protein